MHAINQIRPTFSVVLRSYLRSSDAWGTELGAKVFASINLELVNLSQSTLVWIDYAGLERSDASFQREAVVETIRKHRPRLLFVAINLIDRDIRGNLGLALERRSEILVVLNKDESVEVLGKELTSDQQRILKAVRASPGSGYTSTNLMKPPFDLKPSTASSQLTALWKAGLVERVEGTASSGGREYTYFPIP